MMFRAYGKKNEVFIEMKLNNYDGGWDGRIVMTSYSRLPVVLCAERSLERGWFQLRVRQTHMKEKKT